MYDVASSKAEEFISHDEIMDTLAYAEANKHNRELLDSILAKAATYKGLNHREAAVLLVCDLPEYKEKLFNLAIEIKRKIYGDRVVLFPSSFGTFALFSSTRTVDFLSDIATTSCGTCSFSG